MSRGLRRCKRHDNCPDFIAFATENVALPRNHLRKPVDRSRPIETPSLNAPATLHIRSLSGLPPAVNAVRSDAKFVERRFGRAWWHGPAEAASAASRPVATFARTAQNVAVASAQDQLQSPSEQDEHKVLRALFRTKAPASAMQQIADWLLNIGLGQYASALPRTTLPSPSYPI
jgi:hypothetical protein